MSDETLTSSSAVNKALKSILCRAHNNGVDVEGGWDCRNGNEYPDWDVVVTRVEKNDD